MSHSKSQVDRAGRKVADQIQIAVNGGWEHFSPTELTEAIEVLEWWRSEHARPLSRVAANLRRYARQEGKPVVAQRLKRVPTIADKLKREPTMKLSRMADIGGVRAVVPDQATAYRIAARLRQNWTITKFRDYVAEPKSDGYRALHLVNRNGGRLIEVQLRTPNQDRWANLVETLSRKVAPRLKFGDGPEELNRFLVLSSEVYAVMDRGDVLDGQLSVQFREALKEADTFMKERTP